MHLTFLGIAPLAPAITISKGSMIHLWFSMSYISDANLISVLVMMFGKKLSLQYVNSMSCMIVVGFGCVGGSASRGWLITSNMFGCNFALQWHCCVVHVHGSSLGDGGTFNCFILCNFASYLALYSRSIELSENKRRVQEEFLSIITIFDSHYS